LVFIQKVVNPGDTGDADHVSGPKWDLLDDYHDDIDIEASANIARVNTRTRYRSSKLQIRDSDNSNDYIFVGGALTSEVNINLPDITISDVTPVFLQQPSQIFTEPFTMKKNTAILETLYRPFTTHFSEWGFSFNANDSAANENTYSRIGAEIVDHTNGTEYGAFVVNNIVNGAILNQLYIDSTGLYFSNDATNYIAFTSAGISGNKFYTLPDIDTMLAGYDNPGTFSIHQKFNDYIDLAPIAEPGNPASGYIRVFVHEDDTLLKIKHSNGDVVIIE
jgi:hypothetical protein